MSLFGRALAGAGAAAADITAKYIDEEITMQKMQALEDMRVQTAIRLDEYNYSPERQARVTDAEVKRETAVGDARNAVNLRGKRAEATDVALQTAERENAVQRVIAEAKAKGETMADLEIKYGNDPKFLAAIRKQAQAKHIESAASRAQAALAEATLEDRKRLGELYDQLGTLEGDATMTDEQKVAKAKPIIRQINAIKAKSGGTATREQKYDYTEETVEVEDPKTGTKKKTTTYTPRGQGTAQNNADPFGIGAELEKLRKDKPPPAEKKPLADRAAERPKVDPGSMEAMDIRVLRRIAETPGHVNQKAAQEELKRREEEQGQVDTSGFGYGSVGP